MADKITPGRWLVFGRKTKRWEIAHQELVSGWGINWVRDDMSTICLIGHEVAVMPLPPTPTGENNG